MRASSTARGRVGVLALDQAVSGASNVLAALVAARLLDVAAFGLFFVIFFGYTLFQGAVRSLVCEPALLRPDEIDQIRGPAIRSALALGLACAAVIAAVGAVVLVFDQRLGYGMLALVPFTPLLFLQDLGRYLAIAARVPTHALLLDSLWLALLLVFSGVLALTESHQLWHFVGVWAASGALSGLLVFGYDRVWPKLGIQWIRESWPVAWRYLVSYLWSQGSVVAVTLVVLGFEGAHVLGGVQGALLLQRPFVVFQVAAMSAGVVEVGRVRTDADAVRDVVRKTTRATTMIAAANAAAIVFLPARIGELLLDDVWKAAGPFLWAAAAQVIAMSLMSGARSGLLGRRAVKEATRLGIRNMALIVIFVTVGLVIGGAIVGLWAVAIAHLINAYMWRRTLRAELRLV